MKTIQAAIVTFNKPFFTYNNDGVKQLPFNLSGGSEITTALMIGDSYFEADTIEEIMVEFDRLGFVMPEEDVWDFPERYLRLAIPNDDMTEIIKQVPTIVQTLEYLKDFIVVRNRTQYIYLSEIYPDDKVLFANYIQQRP